MELLTMEPSPTPVSPPDPSPSLDSLVETASNCFLETFGEKPTAHAAAPGRVNLIGEHIDYCDGFVLPFAINRTFVVAYRPTNRNAIRLRTAFEPQTVVIPTDTEPAKSDPPWANYPRGVFYEFYKRGHTPLPSFDGFIVSSVPPGAGLSSSAALEMVFATIVNDLLDSKYAPRDLALMAQAAEHNFAGVPCGIMDQFSSALGRTDHFVLIDCRDATVRHVPFGNPDLSLLIADSAVKHALADGAYAKRRRSTETGLRIIGKPSWREVTTADLSAAEPRMDSETLRRAHHVVSEIGRTIDAVSALETGDFATLGDLMYASHASLRDDFEVSCPELDALVEILAGYGRDRGVIGARMTGGGFGGSVVALCETSRISEIAPKLACDYEARTGRSSRIFTSRPSEGARVLDQIPTSTQ